MEGNRSDVLHPLLLQPLAHKIMIVGPDAPTILDLEDLSASFSAPVKPRAQRPHNDSTTRQGRARYSEDFFVVVSVMYWDCTCWVVIYRISTVRSQIFEHQLN